MLGSNDSEQRDAPKPVAGHRACFQDAIRYSAMSLSMSDAAQILTRNGHLSGNQWGDGTSWMNPVDDQATLASDRRRAEWTERVERYARDAAPRTRPFAVALVEHLPPPVGAHVLDVATGTGHVAVEAARRVGPGGSVLATDFLPAWEPFVCATASAAGVGNVLFASMPAEALALPDASFDVAYCQFGLMFVPEPQRALREMRRVLRPGGRIGIAVWSVPEKVGLFLIPRIVAPALPPTTGEAPPSPMSMGAPGLIEDLVAEAGFRDVVRHALTISHDVADPELVWQQWRENFAMPVGGGLERLPEQVQQQLHDDVIAAFMSFRAGDTVRVPSEAILVTASR
jgi:SAM-dependent methyltransferase